MPAFTLRPLATGLLLAATWAAPCLAQKPAYPQSRRTEQFDEYHGTAVPDPYRWLEGNAKEDAEVGAWVEAQNKLTFKYLEQIPGRDKLRQRLTTLWDYAKYTAPMKVGQRYAFRKNDGLQNQSVLYVTDAWDAPPRVLIDPNAWAADGTIALGSTVFSEDGRLLAYAVAEAGSDWQTWRVMDVDSGQNLPDEVRWSKFTEAAWTDDGHGFFYGRYEAPAEGAAFQDVNKLQKLYYHRVGTPQSADVLVYHRPDQPDWGFQPVVTEDGRWLIITVWKGTADKYRVLYEDLSEPYGMPVDLIDTFDAGYELAGSDGTILYFKTDLNAPRGRLVAIDLRRPQPGHWRQVIPESKDTLTSVNLVGNVFFASYLEDARTAVRAFRMDGTPLRDIELPGIGTAFGFGGRRTDTETFFTYTSFATPPGIYRYDVISGRSELLQQAKVDFESADYVVKQEFYTSKDGTAVPIFVCHKKGLHLDGNNPTLLYGYGGFNIPLTPVFSVSRLAWMEMGGVYAQASLRGGGEYGEDWHQAGMRLKKQNVFDDFIAAAQWLIDQRYTRPAKLAIEGGSNGGLLVGACMTQRPDLFGACLPAVGVMDMLRFHRFTIGWAWIDDYGSADNPQEFEALHAYSPYHNVRPGTAYPPTLITTADTDDRVVPGHSFKFAAALQYAQSGDAPVLIRIETRAGHGAGKPTDKLIEEAADRWSFLVENLGVKGP